MRREALLPTPWKLAAPAVLPGQIAGKALPVSAWGLRCGSSSQIVRNGHPPAASYMVGMRWAPPERRRVRFRSPLVAGRARPGPWPGLAGPARPNTCAVRHQSSPASSRAWQATSALTVPAGRTGPAGTAHHAQGLQRSRSDARPQRSGGTRPVPAVPPPPARSRPGTVSRNLARTSASSRTRSGAPAPSCSAAIRP